MDFHEYIDHLNHRRFLAEFCATPEEAKKRALAIIGSRSVGIGGTRTIAELGLYDALLQNGNRVFCHTYAERADKDEMRHAALTADVYLSSTNAVTQDGILVNIDGTGNRVTGLIYGPHTVVVIVGRNKLVADIPAAIERTKRECCPNNARRLGHNTPCAVTGECADCNSTARMCNVTTLHEYPLRDQTDFHVLVVDADLGW